MAGADLPRTRQVLERELGRLHVGAQVYVSHRGQSVLDLALGLARPDVPMRPDTLMPWMSTSKAVVAAAVGILFEREALHPDDPVCEHIPEFAARGKDRITLRHLLTHTQGMLSADRHLGALRYGQSYEQNVAFLCDASVDPDWPPGRRAGYHTTGGMLLLAETIRRVDGRRIDRFVREEIFEPLGMADSWLGMPRERYRGYGDRLGVMYDTSGDLPKPSGAYAPQSEDDLANIIPGGNGRGPIRELGRFFELLLGRGALGGVRMLSPLTVDLLSARHRTGLRDESWGNLYLDWGLGLMLDSKGRRGIEHYSGYGKHASRRCFGHSGFLSSVAFADPEAELAVALVWNGMPDHEVHTRRQNETCSAIYEDLGLAP